MSAGWPDPDPTYGPDGRRGWPAAELTAGARKIIAEAIRLIETEGWVQRTEWAPGRGYCATGALRHATAPADADHVPAADLAIARMALRARVGIIPTWNDTLPAGDVGKAAVLAELRDLLAADLRAKGEAFDAHQDGS